MSAVNLKLRSFRLKISLKYLIIALYPILSGYIFLPGLTYGNFILFLYLIFKLIVSRTIKTDISFLLMISIFICSNLLQLLINHDVNATLIIHNTFSMVLFLLCVVSLTLDPEDNLQTLYKYLKIISFICSVGLIFQTILWAFFNEKVLLFIPGIKMIAYQYMNAPNFRPSSFFTEPSHFSIYLLPVFALSLVKKDYFYSVFSFLLLILSTSSLGIITAVIILIWQLKNTLLKRINAVRVLLISLAVVLIIIFLIYIESDVTTYALNKLLTIFGKDSSPRLLGSLHYISFFGLLEYLFGIGLNQFSYLVNLKLGLFVPNYSNSVVFSFISFGLVGLIVWLLFIYSVIRKLPADFFSLGIIFLCVCITDQVLFNQNLLYLLVILNIVSKTKGFPAAVL